MKTQPREDSMVTIANALMQHGSLDTNQASTILRNCIDLNDFELECYADKFKNWVYIHLPEYYLLRSENSDELIATNMLSNIKKTISVCVFDNWGQLNNIERANEFVKIIKRKFEEDE